MRISEGLQENGIMVGNTPDHIQHWSTEKFVELTNYYFEAIEVKTMLFYQVKR